MDKLFHRDKPAAAYPIASLARELVKHYLVDHLRVRDFQAGEHGAYVLPPALKFSCELNLSLRTRVCVKRTFYVDKMSGNQIDANDVELAIVSAVWPHTDRD